MGSNIDRDLDRIEELVTKLQVAYDQFFIGQLNREPYEMLKEMEDLLKRYGRGTGLSNTQRFRAVSLTARYNSFKHVWEKKRQLLEGGAPVKAWGVKNVRKAPPPPPVRHTEKPAFHRPANIMAAAGSYEIKGSAIHEERAREIFEHYLELRRKCGEQTAKIRYENFKAVLHENAAKVRAKSGSDTVLFKLDIQGNRARIVAKPAPK